MRDAAFCVFELQDGAFGLSYLMQGDTLRDMLQGRAAPLAGQCSLAMARKFALSASSWPGWRTLLA